MSVMLKSRVFLPLADLRCGDLQRSFSCIALLFNPTRRCSTSTEPSTQTPLSENDVVNPKFTNRNPRNLELMNLARKRKGWRLQYPSVKFYHRVQFEPSHRHTEGFVEHCSGDIIISASTKELCIAKHLYSLTDYCAALNIGRVLARRCLEAGLYQMTILPPINSEHNKKFHAFQAALEDGGVDLTEGEEVVEDYEPGIDYDNEEGIQELYTRQARVAALSEAHAKMKAYRYIMRRGGSNWRVPPEPRSLTPIK